VGAAARHFVDVQRPRFADQILSFTQVPDLIWTDRTVTDRDRTVLGFLVSRSRQDQGRFPTVSEVARALDRSEFTIRRAYHALEDAGYLELGRLKKESRFRARLGYKLKTPGPRLASPPSQDHQGELFTLEGEDDRSRVSKKVNRREQKVQPQAKQIVALPGEQIVAPTPPPINTEERERQTDEFAGTREASCQSVSFTPKPKEEEPSAETVKETEGAKEDAMLIRDYKQQVPVDEVSENEYVDSLIDRASDVFQDATREGVAEAVAQYGCEAVDVALEKAEERIPAPEHWNWVLGTLKNWKREDKLPEPADPKFWLQNYNPPAPISPLTMADMPTDEELPNFMAGAYGDDVLSRARRGFLRGWVKLGLIAPSKIDPKLLNPEPEERKTGRGSVAKLTPRPVGGHGQRALDYTVNGCSRQKKTLDGQGQLAQ